jgi:UDP-3-O-[3-hydroxymyristoyl] glucosamine N-acyltransferase
MCIANNLFRPNFIPNFRFCGLAYKKSAMKHTLKEVAEAIGGRVVGDESIGVNGVATIASAKSGDVVFVDQEKHLDAAMNSQASVVIAGEFAAIGHHAKALIIAAQPKLAFARAAAFLRQEKNRISDIHPSASVHPTARLGKDVSIEARAVICEEAEIGDGTRVGAGSVIGVDVRVGRECEIYPNVTIYPGTKIGDRVIAHAGAVLGSDGFGYVRDRATGRYEKFPQVGTLEIGDDVEIGANTTIDRGALEVTRIGRGAKIDNLVHIGHNCQIGEDVVIAAQAGLSGSITVENNVVLGGQVGIGEHARIEEGVMLGGQGGVLPHKVLRGKGVAFWGTPAKPLREYLKQLAVVARLAKKD